MHDATRNELEQYAERGFFYRERVFPEDEIDDLRQAAEHVHAQILDAAAGEEAPPIDRVDNQRFQMLRGSTIKWEWRDDLRAVRSMEPAFHLDPRFESLIDDPRVWGPCRGIIDCEDLSLFSDKLNVKRPGGAPFPWHQESPYWAHGAEQVESIVSALIYLDDATLENGCFWVIPGSHKHGTLQGLKNRGVLGALYTDVDLVEGEAFAAALPAGSILWFHSSLVHGSQSNRSESDRRVFILAYQPAGLPRWRLDKERPVRTTRLPETRPGDRRTGRNR